MEHAILFRLGGDCFPEILRPCKYLVVVISILPPDRHHQEVKWTLGGVQTQCIPPVARHVLEHGDRNALIDEGRIDTLDAQNLRKNGVKVPSNPVRKVLVQVKGERPVHLPQAVGIELLDGVTVLHQGPGRCGILNRGNSTVGRENHRLADVLDICDLGRSDVLSLGMDKRDPVLRIAIIGGAVHHADKGTDHIAELIFGKDPGSASHFRARNGIEVELGDDSEVIPTAPESPVKVRIRVYTSCHNGTACSNDLLSVSF